MKVAVESIGSFQRKIQITVSKDKVKTQLDSAFKNLSRKVRLPGFRPGKAPRKVLEARFGADIRSDVANALIQRSYQDAISTEKLSPVGQPTLDDLGEVKSNTDFNFTVIVDVKPEVALKKVKGVDVVFPKVEVAKDEIEASIRARLEGQARLVEVTGRPVEKGDMVLVELEAKEGKEVVANEPGTMIRTEADPYYPGLEDFLVGVNVGKSKKGKVTFADDARTEAVAGKELSVKAKVLSIQANEVPELDNKIAEEMGYEGGAKGMRAAIKGELTKKREELARNQARANLLESLIEANPFEVPAGMVDQSLKMLMDELRLQQAYMGRDPRSLSFSDAQMSDLRMRAEFASKAGLILEQVGDTESIEITDADLDKKYQDLADERGQSLEAVKGYFVKDDAIEELKARMLEEKTLDWLLERANLVDEKKPAKKAKAPAKEAKKAPAKEAKKAKAPAKEAKKAPAKAKKSGGADLSILKGAVGAVKKAIDTGDHDAHLAELLAAEEAGKARKGAIAAITKRMNG